ncbi:MAG TPA: tetratricopeptide repeat protein, partial [Steroidobacteraceae bacterium]|nr:tetratricopeptide repeat protein [Steroidobacteraceae bacterium]
YFEALERLDAEMAQYRGLDEPQLDTLTFHINEAEFSVGDFELSYRMHHRAGRAIKAVLEGAVDEAVRNEAAFRLARIHFQKGQAEDALQALERIEGKVPERIAAEVAFLRANVFMALGRPADAVPVLEELQRSESLRGFSQYNLGIALLQDGREAEALEQLERAGEVRATDPATAAIRDKSNLVLGTLRYEASEFDAAQRSLDRVRLEGAFSNQALLSAGWADMAAENYERAIVPWGLLAARERTDAAVQEAMLALPYAYGKLNVHGRAAMLYANALEGFGAEIDKIDASVTSIREGRFLEALVREEIRQDKDWVIRLRSLPQTPETYYLMALMASHDFQTALQNYLDLEDLRKKLAAWERSFDAYDDMIGLRRQYYEPVLPEVDAEFRELDSLIRLRFAQRDQLEKRLQHLLIAPRPELLATADERIVGERLRAIDAALEGLDDPRAAELRERVRRLDGVLIWNLKTEYHERLTEAHAHLRELNADVAVLKDRYESFVRSRQAAPHSYLGYDDPILRLRQRVREAQDRIETLMARQGHLLETVAINELEQRRERLVAYQTKARYAVADSYDRAAKVETTGAVR